MVVSFNPGYRRGLKELKPSTRQRFVALEFGYPPADVEAEIVQAESGVAAGVARAAGRATPPRCARSRSWRWRRPFRRACWSPPDS